MHLSVAEPSFPAHQSDVLHCDLARVRLTVGYPTADRGVTSGSCRPISALPEKFPTRVFWVSRSQSLGLPPGTFVRSLHRLVSLLSSTLARLPVPSSAEGGLSECTPSFSVVPGDSADL